MSVGKTPATGGIPELRDACERFDEALRTFARNPLASRDLAHQAMGMLFTLRELERELNGGKHVA
ncbi:hypothetical protein JKG47_11790 [Acidithiobacillus sp. MC6.1]|nr:hypothetical protein [Acidithiobacillus sp. MC6.1]